MLSILPCWPLVYWGICANGCLFFIRVVCGCAVETPFLPWTVNLYQTPDKSFLPFCRLWGYGFTFLKCLDVKKKNSKCWCDLASLFGCLCFWRQRTIFFPYFFLKSFKLLSLKFRFPTYFRFWIKCQLGGRQDGSASKGSVLPSSNYIALPDALVNKALLKLFVIDIWMCNWFLQFDYIFLQFWLCITQLF